MTDLPDTDAPTVVRLSAPEDLVAALPSLLGFVPTRSLVAIAMLTREGRTRLGGMARVDLPGPGDDPGEYADAVVARLAASAPSWVQLVVITDSSPDGPLDRGPLERGPRDGAPGDGGVEGDPSSPPEADLVGTFRAGFAAAAIETPAPLWAARIAAGAPWRCYDECACSGTLPDPAASQAAAARAVITSRVVYRSRAEAEGALAPDPDAGSARRRELIEDAYWDALTERSSDAAAAARAGLDTVRAAIAGAGRGTPLEEAVLARVAVALGDPAVRDVCLGFAAGRDPGVDPEHATRLWWQLTRALPAPEVAQPATLLAFASLRRGGGVTLTVALERAIRADPDHQLSRLLDQIVSAGIGPEQIEALVLSAAAEAEERNRAQ